MKKIITIFMLLGSLICFSGCENLFNSNGNNGEVQNVTGRLYKVLSLKDTTNNVLVFKSIVPSDWKGLIESNWNIVSSSTPGKETIYLSNLDGTAKITFVSQQTFVENNKYSEGENREYYTTYLHYMNAKEYLDYFVNKEYKGSKLVKELEEDDKLSNQLKEYNKIRYNAAQNDANELNKVTPSVNISVKDYATSVSKKQYQLGDNYIEASTGVVAIETDLTSSISNLLSSKAIDWTMPYVIIYTAENKEIFDKYYDDYKFIVANSEFTLDYYQMLEYVASKITNLYTSYYAAKAKAGLDAMNDYINSNYSSDSSKSSHEKVMEMWDDVIKEVDSYKTDDGTTIKTSIMNDSVAQKGDEIYIGSKAGIPEGFNELAKSY